MPKRGTTSLRSKPCSPPFSERPSCQPVTPPPRGRRDLGRWCPSDIRCDGDSRSIPYSRTRRKRPTGAGAQCASAPTPPRPPSPKTLAQGASTSSRSLTARATSRRRDHGDVDAIRHDVVSIVVAGERQARLCHLIGAWQWAESRECDLGRQTTKTAHGRKA